MLYIFDQGQSEVRLSGLPAPILLSFASLTIPVDFSGHTVKKNIFSVEAKADEWKHKKSPWVLLPSPCQTLFRQASRGCINTHKGLLEQIGQR